MEIRRLDVSTLEESKDGELYRVAKIGESVVTAMIGVEVISESTLKVEIEDKINYLYYKTLGVF